MVRVPGPVNRLTTVLVSAYDRRHHLLDKFPKTVHTRNADLFTGPPPPAVTWSVTARQ
jgi:hypothetical protein